MLIKYQKHITQERTVELFDVTGTELCTIAGWTYFSCAALPADQDALIQPTIAQVTPDKALKDAIKLASPHCWLIKERRQQAILGAGYDEKDQTAFLHFGIKAALAVSANLPGLPPDVAAALTAIGDAGLSKGQMSALMAYASTCIAADKAAESAYAALGL